MPQPTRSTPETRALLTSEIIAHLHQDGIFRLLSTINTTLLIGSLMIVIIGITQGWLPSISLGAFGSLVFAGNGIFLRRGWIQAACVTLVSALLVIAETALVVGDGIHDVAVILLPMVMVVGGLLIHVRYFGLIAGLTIACAAVTGFLEIQGIINNKFSSHFQVGDVLVLIVMLTTFGLLMRVLTGLMVRSLVQAATSKMNYLEIFNATGEAIFLYDAQTGRILDFNDTAMQMYGLSRDNLDSLAVADISAGRAPYSEAEAAGHLQRTVNDGQQVFEWCARRLDGREFWTEVALSSTEIGGKGRILALVRDIDERKALQVRLQQAEKLESLGKLAGGIAHDFNNQLACIMGYADLAKAEAGDPIAVDQNVDTILVAAKRASDLTAKLLAFARKGKHQSTSVDLNGLVKEVQEIGRRSIDPGIRIEAHLDASGAITLGDPTQLQNAILNLVFNARDAMPDGGRLKIGTRAVDLTEAVGTGHAEPLVPGRYVELSVGDTGVGMTPEVLKHIFDPFFTTKAVGAGTGMGLAAVYGTVQHHGGAIDVESTPGEGTTFRILLPHHAGREEPAPQPAVSPPVRSDLSARILVVDDDPNVNRMIVGALQSTGSTLSTCADGVEALRVFQDDPRRFDLVILDLTMPRMAGPETFRALRSLGSDLPVLIISGYAINEQVQDLLDEGAAGFLQKPFRAEDLCAAVAAVLGKAPADPVE